MNRILLLDSERPAFQRLSEVLSANGYEPIPATGATGWATDADVIVTVPERLAEVSQTAPVIVMAAAASIRSAVEAMRNGASDYLAESCTDEELSLIHI